MKRTKYTSEFKKEEAKQIIAEVHLVPDVDQRLGVTEGVLYTWLKKFKKDDEPVASGDLKAMQAEMAELRRTTEGRDILKKGRRVLCQTVRVKSEFIKEHRTQFRLTSMRRVLRAHRSGYYAWLHEPLSPKAKEKEALTLKIREFYDHSLGIYGSPRIFCDLREAGLACGENRVARLMSVAHIRSVRAYKRPRYKVGKPALVEPNQLQRQFQHDAPDQAWVTDITYIRTQEG